MDSQVDGGNMIMSAGESDSDSDLGDANEAEDFPETNYVQLAEEEFGAVIIFEVSLRTEIN